MTVSEILDHIEQKGEVMINKDQSYVGEMIEYIEEIDQYQSLSYSEVKGNILFFECN